MLIDLSTAATPNGHKISIALEELSVPYQLISVNFVDEEQRQPEFLKLNPNGKIPVIVDAENDNYVVFESGAILIYMPEKYGGLMPSDSKGRSEAFQMDGIGPMMGQANVLYRYFEVKIQPAIDRYQHEVKKLFAVLSERLAKSEYLANRFSIADIANWPCVRLHDWSSIIVEEFANLQCWMNQLSKRPALIKGIGIPPGIDLSDADELIGQALKMLVT